ncbi:HGxxPAAW family protein [Streptomyces sp. QTS52]
MAGSSHGHTLAAWTGVTISIIGFCVAGAFMVMAEPLGFWAGMVLSVLGGVVGWIMAAMGLGKQKPTTQGREGHQVTREPAGAGS